MLIGQVASRSEVPAKTIRYYESVGLLPTANRHPNGYRDYSETILDRLAFIRAAQSSGFTLGEIKEIIAFRDQGQAPCGHVRDLIDQHATEVEQRIAELQHPSRTRTARPTPRPNRLPTIRCLPHPRPERVFSVETTSDSQWPGPSRTSADTVGSRAEPRARRQRIIANPLAVPHRTDQHGVAQAAERIRAGAEHDDRPRTPCDGASRRALQPCGGKRPPGTLAAMSSRGRSRPVKSLDAVRILHPIPRRDSALASSSKCRSPRLQEQALPSLPTAAREYR